MKLDTSSKHLGYFLLYAALLTIPALAVDVRAFSTFEPLKVLVTIGIGALLGWWSVMRWGAKDKGESQGQETGKGANQRLLAFAYYGYWISLLIATVMSVAPWVSLFGLAPRYQGLLMYIAIFIASMGISKLSRKQLESVLGVAIVGGVVVSAFGILQGLIPALTQWWDIDSFLGRTFSTMGHPSYLADYLLLVAPLFYWKWVTSRRWLRWSLLGIIVGVALLLTMSRGAFLGLAASGLFFVGVYGYWHKQRGLLMSAIVIPLLLVVLVAGVNILPFRSGAHKVPLLNRLVVSQENLRSVSTRFVLWPSVARRVLERPLFGYGPDTFALSFAKAAPKELLQSENFNAYADRAHNFFLDSMINVGVVGTGFLILLLCLIIRVVIRSGDPLFLALGSAIVGHIISQQFEFSLTVHLIFLWVYIGIIFGFYGKGSFHLQHTITFPKWVRIVAKVVVSLFVIGIFWGYIVPTFLADRLAREEDYGKAIMIAPHRSEYVLAEARSQIEERRDPRHILNLLHGVKLFSGDLDYRPYFYEGIMWNEISEYPKSFLAFEEAIKRSPIFPPLYKSYGEALLKSGDRKAALVQFNTYVDLAPPYWKMKELYKKGELKGWDKQQYEVFYKLNPDFDTIFELIQKASIAK